MKYTSDRFAVILFRLSVGCLLLIYGIIVGRYNVFPSKIVDLAEDGAQEILDKFENNLPEYFRSVEKPHKAALYNSKKAYKGLNLVAHIAAGYVLSVKIIDMDGKKLHEWKIDWFEIWPDAKHLPDRIRPVVPPGTLVFGAVVMENGDLVFNFEDLGLVRLDRQGNVVWRLPYRTHHLINRHTDGNLWVCGVKEHAEPSDQFPNYEPPFDEYMLLIVTPEGKIVKEWSVAEILTKNGLTGLLYLGTLQNRSTQVRAKSDRLHLNDFEPFPDTLEEGFFKNGDALVSLRNINTVFVFNIKSEKITFISFGQFVRQHDPDFIDGNTFSVFDNNNIAPEEDGPQSRIVICSASDQKYQVYFKGTPKMPFYTDIMGNHQWLPNGNLLITESCNGRAFEINRSGKIVWEYINYVDTGVVGLVTDVQRLPLEYARLFQSENPSKNIAGTGFMDGEYSRKQVNYMENIK